MQITYQRTAPAAQQPTMGSEGAACFDFYALLTESVFIEPQSKTIIKTGIAVEVPKGFVMLLFSRSGQGFNNNVRLANCVGVIDSDYRGEIMAALANDNTTRVIEVKPGERIVQGMLLAAPNYKFIEAESLSDTKRGKKGFGSTDK